MERYGLLKLPTEKDIMEDVHVHLPTIAQLQEYTKTTWLPPVVNDTRLDVLEVDADMPISRVPIKLSAIIAAHPDDRARMIAEPNVVPFAIEEFLRAYAPVTMARLVQEPVTIGEAEMQPGDWVLLPFPAGNRDPEAFEDADRVIIDRERNRHSAFGLGIHRCIGSNLARMELTVAVTTWLERVPEFRLSDPAGIRWSAGQIRGPRLLPVGFPATT